MGRKQPKWRRGADKTPKGTGKSSDYFANIRATIIGHSEKALRLKGTKPGHGTAWDNAKKKAHVRCLPRGKVGHAMFLGRIQADGKSLMDDITAVADQATALCDKLQDNAS